MNPDKTANKKKNFAGNFVKSNNALKFSILKFFHDGTVSQKCHTTGCRQRGLRLGHLRTFGKINILSRQNFPGRNGRKPRMAAVVCCFCCSD